MIQLVRYLLRRNEAADAGSGDQKIRICLLYGTVCYGGFSVFPLSANASFLYPSTENL
jgi:hypothetical protein